MVALSVAGLVAGGARWGCAALRSRCAGGFRSRALRTGPVLPALEPAGLPCRLAPTGWGLPCAGCRFQLDPTENRIATSDVKDFDQMGTLGRLC